MQLSSDSDRLLFFEHICRIAEASYAKNPLDADNLNRWGDTLLEWSQFQNGPDPKHQMLQDAIDKLEEALVVDPKMHRTHWCLGNAYTYFAYLIPGGDEAKSYFDKADKCFGQAYELEPESELYKISLEIRSGWQGTSDA